MQILKENLLIKVYRRSDFMYLKIRTVQDRIRGYKVSQVKIEVPNQKAKALVLKIEEADDERI